MSGWGSGDQSADEEQIMAAFEEGLALNSAKRSPRIRPTPARRHGSQSRRASSRQSLRIRSLVSPPRRRREAAYYEGAAHALVSPPRVRPYFDSALPYFSTPVAKLASQAAIRKRVLGSLIRSAPLVAAFGLHLIWDTNIAITRL